MNNFKWTEINIICEGSTEENFVKRILNKYFNAKQIKLKPINGNIISEKIGLELMRERCPRFNKWISKIENKVEELR